MPKTDKNLASCLKKSIDCGLYLEELNLNLMQDFDYPVIFGYAQSPRMNAGIMPQNKLWRFSD